MNMYIYRMTSDSGGAPCVQNGLLSLAICKPDIRRMASKGDLIFGIGGKALGERLIYAAYVTQKCLRDAYYTADEFRGRADCIYDSVAGVARIRADARHHQGGGSLEHDVGSRFERGHVLLSDNFRYFGIAGTTGYQSTCPHMTQKFLRLGPGHRVFHSGEIQNELDTLAKALWEQPAAQAKPSNKVDDDCSPCADDEEDQVITASRKRQRRVCVRNNSAPLDSAAVSSKGVC